MSSFSSFQISDSVTHIIGRLYPPEATYKQSELGCLYLKKACGPPWSLQLFFSVCTDRPTSLPSNNGKPGQPCKYVLWTLESSLTTRRDSEKSTSRQLQSTNNPPTQLLHNSCICKKKCALYESFRIHCKINTTTL